MFRPSMLGDLLKLLPRAVVHNVAVLHGSNRWRKSFKLWDHVVAMVAVHLAGRTSLREAVLLLSHRRAHHYHLNCRSVKRSTLADANKTRDSAAFADIVKYLIKTGGRRERQPKAMLSILDSSPIRLDGRGHHWAEASRSRNRSQGLKLHLLTTPEDGGLDYAAVTDMNVNDITEAMTVSLDAGRIYLFDKGYCDYNWWHDILEAGSHFVTRIKTNAAWRMLEERPVDAPHIVSDRIIELTNKAPRGGKINRLAGHPLRLVEIEHPAGKGAPFLIVSDLLDVPASEIAALYKQRWDIELLFKWLKQNLKIKRFLGESRNAILIQIYTALIAYLLLRAYRKLLGKKIPLRLKDLAVMCQIGLLQPVHVNPATPPSTLSHQEILPL